MIIFSRNPDRDTSYNGLSEPDVIFNDKYTYNRYIYRHLGAYYHLMFSVDILYNASSVLEVLCLVFQLPSPSRLLASFMSCIHSQTPSPVQTRPGQTRPPGGSGTKPGGSSIRPGGSSTKPGGSSARVNRSASDLSLKKTKASKMAAADQSMNESPIPSLRKTDSYVCL